MRPSLRFLIGVVMAWVGVRAATLGMLPGASILHTQPSEAHPGPVAPTQFPSLDQIASVAPIAQTDTATAPATAVPLSAPLPAYAAWPAGFRPIFVRASSLIAASAPALAKPAQYTTLMPEPRPAFFASLPVLDEWPLSRLASEGHQAARSEVSAAQQTPVPAIQKAKLDRVQLSMWALLRSSQALAVSPPPSLGTGGMLGGSQAGARLIYNINALIAAVLRTSTDVGRRGGEAALGVRIHPLQSLPVWITAERRQAIGKYGDGRSAFAIFAEGGVYDRPLGGRFVLNGYAQAGMVGLRRRDLFAEGAVTVTRPVYKRFSAGFGVWAGTQPGIYRVDVGPRITMRVRNNVRVHFDYRQRVAGNALPGSGPTVTLAGDF